MSKRTRISLQEREQIELLISRNFDIKQMCQIMGRSEAGICHEIRLNGGREKYKASEAEKGYLERKKASVQKIVLTKQGKTYEGSPHPIAAKDPVVEEKGKEFPIEKFKVTSISHIGKEEMLEEFEMIKKKLNDQRDYNIQRSQAFENLFQSLFKEIIRLKELMAINNGLIQELEAKVCFPHAPV